MNLLILDGALINAIKIERLSTCISKQHMVKTQHMSKHRHYSQSWIIGQDSERQDDSVTDINSDYEAEQTEEIQNDQLQEIGLKRGLYPLIHRDGTRVSKHVKHKHLWKKLQQKC